MSSVTHNKIISGFMKGSSMFIDQHSKNSQQYDVRSQQLLSRHDQHPQNAAFFSTNVFLVVVVLLWFANWAASKSPDCKSPLTNKTEPALLLPRMSQRGEHCALPPLYSDVWQSCLQLLGWKGQSLVHGLRKPHSLNLFIFYGMSFIDNRNVECQSTFLPSEGGFEMDCMFCTQIIQRHTHSYRSELLNPDDQN